MPRSLAGYLAIINSDINTGVKELDEEESGSFSARSYDESEGILGCYDNDHDRNPSLDIRAIRVQEDA